MGGRGFYRTPSKKRKYKSARATAVFGADGAATTTPRGAAGYDHAPGERHAFSIAHRRAGGNRLGVFVGRHRFAGQRRLLGAEVL
jgi:hypothetical protein